MRSKADRFESVLSWLILAAFMASLWGCSLIQAGKDNPATAQLTVQYATLKVVDGNPERAERVVELAEQARSFVDKDSDATLDLLADRVHEQIPWAELAPEDRLLIDALLSRLHAELQDRIGEGVLAEDDRVVIRTVLDWIIAAASG